MVILAILAAAILGTASAAMEAGRRSRTQTTVKKISDLILERYASYETRRAEIGSQVTNLFLPGKPQGQVLQDLRLLSLRELIKYEMPDRWSDVTEIPRILEQAPPRRPQLAERYRARYLAAMEATGDDDEKVLRYENAECLYLTVMFATGDGEARTLFQKNEIGDIDEDGASEFHDGWGNPIEWIRWPAGMLGRSDLMQGVDHDPLDPYVRNSATAKPVASDFPPALEPYIIPLRNVTATRPAGFRLVPLIYSPGPDGFPDIDSAAVSTTAGITGADPIALDPYAVESDGTFQFATVEDLNDDGEDNSIDNIQSHITDY